MADSGQLQNDTLDGSLDLAQFAAKLAQTTRNQKVLLQNLFRTEILSENTNRSIRLHILKADGNKRPQVGQLVSHLSCTVLEYCIPRKQIQSAYDDYNTTGSSIKTLALAKEARKLFTDISNSGEGGELLLFILTETILGYPQVLSKMSIKTSSKMHFHGLDGVYISCKGNPAVLRLHFGESKLHKSPEGSIREAISSIAALLNDEGFIESARRDYYLLNTQTDLGSYELEDALKRFLDPMDAKFLAPEICAVLLSGHELEDYPAVIENEPLPIELMKKANKLIETLEINATNMNIDGFHIDLFLVPFPNLQAFRDQLLKELDLK